jgi:heptosyltransferase III
VKLLFITSSRIGDAILSTGTLNYMIEQHPGIAVTVATAPLTAPLFEGVPNLERLIAFEKRSYSRHWIDVWRQCRRASWDIIIDIRGSLVSYFLKPQHRYVWKSTNSPHHRVVQMGHLMGAAHPPSPHLWLRAADIRQAESLIPEGQPVLALAPAANWIGKQWPAESFAKLVTQFLANYDAKIAVFAAPHERGMISSVLEAIPAPRRLDLVGQLSLLEIAACLKRCKVFLGNDSGLMHMAAAVGTPTIGLFGPSDSNFYGPWGKNNQVVRIPESLKDLKKRPDFSFHSSHTFMDQLKPETVSRALEKMWA